MVAVPARPDNIPARSDSIGLVAMRGEAPVLAGSNLYEGEHLVTPWHHHDLHQLEYAAQGVVEVETEAGHYLLPPHQAAWIPAGLEHQTTIATAVRTVAVLFDPSLVPEPGDRVRIVAVPPLLREMVLHSARWPIDRAADDEVAESYFGTLAHLVADALDHEAPLCLPSSSDPALAAAMTFTREHLDSVTAADVGRAVGLSERTLRRRFSDEVGLPWRSYLVQARMLRAMALLAEPGPSVLEVALAVGFEDTSAFSRAFARHCGETPSQYRRRLRGS